MENRDIKILLDFRRNYINSECFSKEIIDDEVHDDDYELYTYSQKDVYSHINKFDYLITNSIGGIDFRKAVFKEIINEITNSCKNKVIILHFLGHGAKSGGVEFAEWDFFIPYFQAVRKNNSLYINLMGVCHSNTLAAYTCYDKLWAVEGEARDIVTPFELYGFTNFIDFHKAIEYQLNPMARSYRYHYCINEQYYTMGL